MNLTNGVSGNGTPGASQATRIKDEIEARVRFRQIAEQSDAKTACQPVGGKACAGILDDFGHSVEAGDFAAFACRKPKVIAHAAADFEQARACGWGGAGQMREVAPQVLASLQLPSPRTRWLAPS